MFLDMLPPEDHKHAFCGPHNVQGLLSCEEQDVSCVCVRVCVQHQTLRLLPALHLSPLETTSSLWLQKGLFGGFILLVEGEKEKKNNNEPHDVSFDLISSVSRTRIGNVWNKIHLVNVPMLSQSHATGATKDFHLSNRTGLLSWCFIWS